MGFNLNKLIVFLGLSLALFSAGCSEVSPPTPEDIIRQPLGESPLRIGMTKEKVRSLWGDPDIVNVVKSDAQGMVQEEWIYHGRYPGLPINVDYLAETQHLFFEGSHLVKFYHTR